MSHPTSKSNPQLGEQVRAHLVSLGLETPMTDLVNVPADDKIAAIEPMFTSILKTLGLDLTDDSLIDTPRRVAKMYVNEIFWGLDYSKFPKCTAIENKMSTPGSFVLERDVNVQSNCEHHLVVIDGLATVAYIPKKYVLGLSKINRLVEFFAKRPQVQERLTEQIRAAISFIVESEDVAVYIDAKHYCVKSRGIQDTGSSTVTLSVGGKFLEDQNIRTEFLALARLSAK